MHPPRSAGAGDAPAASAEDHYVLSPPQLVERVTRAGRTPIAPPADCPWGTQTGWTEPGRGRTAAAAALVADATGGDVGRRLAVAFTSDVLDFVRAPAEPLVITAAEVRAWRGEREPEIVAHWPPWSGALAIADALAIAERGGPRSDWLAVYRAVHGEPRVKR